MGYIGKFPTAIPITSSDLADGIVTVPKLATTLDLSSNTITLPAGVGGKILQIVQSTSTSNVQSTSGSFASTGFSSSITPSSTSSKILIMADCAYEIFGNNADSNYGAYFKLVRSVGGSDGDVFNPNAPIPHHYNAYTGASFSVGMYNMQELDNPTTTSQCTYTIYMAAKTGTNNRASLCPSSARSTIILMEVSG